MRIEDLDTPAFLVDKEKMEGNCSRMLEMCKKYGVKLRAQTKTHKTIEGSILQTDGTKRCIVTSTLNETEFYADHGFDDILFGYMFGPQHLSRCVRLRSRLSEFHMMVDNWAGVNTLQSNPPPEGTKWSVFLSINCGDEREGVWWEDTMVEDLAEAMHKCSHINFKGVYTHCGNSYKAADFVEKVRDDSSDRVLSVVSRITARGIPCPTFGIGSTPSCSKPGEIISKLTEVHPGNYAFYDTQQMGLGSCKESEIACCVATRVVGHYPRRNQILVDAGFTALSKQGWNQDKGYFEVVIKGEPNLKYCKSSQEYGYIDTFENPMDYTKYPIGKMLFIYPYHACPTAAQFPVYYVCKDNDIIEQWTPTRGWN